VVPSKSIQTNLPSMHTVCRMVLAEEEAEHETRRDKRSPSERTIPPQRAFLLRDTGRC
jgi:hypothetical protein